VWPKREARAGREQTKSQHTAPSARSHRLTPTSYPEFHPQPKTVVPMSIFSRQNMPVSGGRVLLAEVFFFTQRMLVRVCFSHRTTQQVYWRRFFNVGPANVLSCVFLCIQANWVPARSGLHGLACSTAPSLAAVLSRLLVPSEVLTQSPRCEGTTPCDGKSSLCHQLTTTGTNKN